MEIPPIGFLIFALVGIMALLRPNSLIYLCAFFVPFSGTAVVNLKNFDFGVVAFTYAAVVWLVMYVMFALSRGRLVGSWGEPVCHCLILFVTVLCLSLIMPVIIDGRDKFQAAVNVGPVQSYSIQFSLWHVIHLGYVFVGAIFVIAGSAVLKHGQRIELAIRAYVLGGVFAAVIGLLEIVFYFLGLRFPISFFNSVPTSDLAATMGHFDGGLGLLRISSVAQEPSLFGEHIAVISAIIWAHVISGKMIFSRLIDLTFATLITGSLIFSLSTVAYAGLTMVVGLIGFLSLRTVRGRRNVLLLIILLIASLAFTIKSVPASQEVIDYFVLNKMHSGSFLERMSTTMNALELAMHYPLLGVGWGVVPSFDLFVKIFVGAGVLGVIAFLLLWFASYRSVQQVRRILKHQEWAFSSDSARAQADGLLIGLLVLTVIYMFTGFEYRYGDLWFLLTMIVAMRQRYRTTKLQGARRMNQQLERGRCSTPRHHPRSPKNLVAARRCSCAYLVDVSPRISRYPARDA